VLVFTACDPGGSAIYRVVRGRFALYNELVRAAADAHGADVVDFWRMREYRHWGFWDVDRMHLGPAGHLRMATAVLETLGVPHDLPHAEPRALVVPPAHDRLRENLAWTRQSALPCVHRRLAGRSSGDGMAPRYPTLRRPASPGSA